MKHRNWFWGIFLICSAAMIVLFQTGIAGFGQTVGAWEMIFAVALAAILVTSIVNINFYGITFSVAFLLKIFNAYLHIPESLIPKSGIPWLLLAIAFLLALGLSILFNGKTHRFKKNCNIDIPPGNAEVFSDTSQASNDDEIVVRSSFGGVVKYVNSQNLKRIFVSNTFGGVKIFLNQAQLSPDGAEIRFESTFGGVELFVPSTWRVTNQISSIFGGFDERNKVYNNDGPAITLTGKNTFGGITINYI